MQALSFMKYIIKLETHIFFVSMFDSMTPKVLHPTQSMGIIVPTHTQSPSPWNYLRKTEYKKNNDIKLKY